LSAAKHLSAFSTNHIAETATMITQRPKQQHKKTTYTDMH